LCQFSVIEQATRRAKMSIQRHHGSFPPAISAENMQNMHKLRILRIKNLLKLFLASIGLISTFAPSCPVTMGYQQSEPANVADGGLGR
jgi:hypothetical protein